MSQRAEVERELAALQQRTQLSGTEVRRLEELSRERVQNWRKLLRKHVPQERQILQKMLRGHLTFVPERRGIRNGYRFKGEGSLMPLLSGMIPELSEAFTSSGVPNPNVAPPALGEDGMEWTPITGWVAA
jgi:hypothetical protein